MIPICVVFIMSIIVGWSRWARMERSERNCKCFIVSKSFNCMSYTIYCSHNKKKLWQKKIIAVRKLGLQSYVSV